jgi:hypothetical protein
MYHPHSFLCAAGYEAPLEQSIHISDTLQQAEGLNVVECPSISTSHLAQFREKLRQQIEQDMPRWKEAVEAEITGKIEHQRQKLARERSKQLQELEHRMHDIEKKATGRTGMTVDD